MRNNSFYASPAYSLRFFALVLKLVDLPTIKQIKTASDSQTAIDFRKKLLHNRKIAFWVFVGLIIAYSLYDLKYLDEIEDSSTIGLILFAKVFSIVLLYCYLKASNKYQEIQGKVSTLSAEEFLANNSRFILYLRGFESDVYNSQDIGKWDFSEDTLSKVIRKGLGIPMCAVGMTKEADSPAGGERVYVEDSTWEDDVFNLMQKAEKIVIRVNDRTSCLWEISKSKGFLSKCTFLADDLSKYDNARNELSDDVKLPDIPPAGDEDLPLEYDPRAFFFSSDLQMKDFQGVVADYCEMVGLDRETVTDVDIKDNKKKPFYQRPFFIFLMIIGALNAIRILFR